MRRNPHAFLWDVQNAAHAIERFSSGRTEDDFLEDEMLRAAVERQFEIIGEALNQLNKVDAAMAARIPDLAQIIAFRNLLIHGYAVIDARRVWRIRQTASPPLIEAVTALLVDDATS